MGLEGLNPGAFRHQIQIQRKSVSGLNGFGEDVFSWSKVVDCRAQITSLQSGRELDEKAGQIWEEALYEIKMHWFRGLNSAMRVVWQTGDGLLALNITNVSDPFGTQRVITMSARNLPDETGDVAWL